MSSAPPVPSPSIRRDAGADGRAGVGPRSALLRHEPCGIAPDSYSIALVVARDRKDAVADARGDYGDRAWDEQDEDASSVPLTAMAPCRFNPRRTLFPPSRSWYPARAWHTAVIEGTLGSEGRWSTLYDDIIARMRLPVRRSRARVEPVGKDGWLC